MAIDISGHDPDASSGEEVPAKQWLRWIGDADRRVLSHHGGQIVRNIGTGLLMAFENAHHCVQAAFALNQLADSLNARVDESRHLHLRTVAHLAHHLSDQDEPLDGDMQSISALTTWAGPGDVLVTAELRDRLANGLDADFEDLGLPSRPPRHRRPVHRVA